MPRVRSVALTDWGEAGSVSSTKTAFESRDMLFGKLRPYFHKVGIAPTNGVCSSDIVRAEGTHVKMVRFRPRLRLVVWIRQLREPDFDRHEDASNQLAHDEPVRDMPARRACRNAAFQNVVALMLERIVIANVHESRTLSFLRDALLPKLVSGELRVDGLEPATGSVDNPAPVGTHEA